MMTTIPDKAGVSRLISLAEKARGKIKAIYLHWTAGHYGQFFDDYHICIDRDGSVRLTGDDFLERKSHTWGRNGKSIGIALCCGYGAVLPSTAVEPGRRGEPLPDGAIPFGPEPPTWMQIERLAVVTALLCHHLFLPVSALTVMTHGEAALLDGYGPGDGDPDLRWDLWYLPDRPARLGLHPGGEVVRGKARWYLDAYQRNGSW